MFIYNVDLLSTLNGPYLKYAFKSDEDGFAEVLSLSGQRLCRFYLPMNTNTIMVPSQDLNEGFYLCHVKSTSGFEKTFKFTIFR